MFALPLEVKILLLPAGNTWQHLATCCQQTLWASSYPYMHVRLRSDHRLQRYGRLKILQNFPTLLATCCHGSLIGGSWPPGGRPAASSNRDLSLFTCTAFSSLPTGLTTRGQGSHPLQRPLLVSGSTFQTSKHIHPTREVEGHAEVLEFWKSDRVCSS